MAGEYKGLTVEFGANTTTVTAALRKAKSEARGVATELRNIDKALKLDPGNTALLSQQQKDYRRQIESTQKQLKIFKQLEADVASGKQKMDDSQWTKLQSDIALAESNLKKYKAALTESMVQQRSMNSLLGKAGAGLEKFGSKLNGASTVIAGMGSALTRTVTPAIGAAAGASVAAAVKIDTSLTGVRKTVDGTEEQYQALKQSAIEFSKTNAVSASQILDIQALGAQLGFSIDELDEFGKVVSGLDIATNMDAETAATEMAQFANITKMAHSEVSNYGSAIVNLGNHMATTESDISSMAQRVAAASSQVGMSQADILGWSAAMSSLGVEAEAGGTAFSATVATIDKAVATNGENLQAFAKIAGMSAEDFASSWKASASDTMIALLQGADSAENMSVALEEMGVDGIRQTDVLKRLAGNTDLVTQALQYSNDGWRENTALQNEVDNRNDSLAAKFEMVKNRVIALADKVGGPLADALLDAIDAAEPLFEAMESGAQAFADMDKEQQQLILGLIALAAALGPILSVTGRALGGVEALGKGFQKLSTLIAKVKTPADGAATGIRKVATASNVAKGAFVAFAAVGVAMLLSGFAQLNERASDFKNGTVGLQQAARGAYSAFQTEAQGIQSVSDVTKVTADSFLTAAQKVAQGNDDVAKAQANTAQSMRDANSTAYADIAKIDSYGKTIEELTGKYDENGDKAALTAEEQGRLQAAVDGLNGSLGTSYSVMDAANGVIAENGQAVENAREAIEKYIEQKKIQIQLDSLQSQYTSVLQDQETASQNLAAAKQAEAAAQQKVVEAQKLAEAGGGSAALQQASQEWADAKTNLVEAQALYNSASGAVSTLTDKMNWLGVGLAGQATQWQQFLMTSPTIQAAFMNMNGVAGTFSDKMNNLASDLAACGISTEQFSSLSTEQIQQLAMSWDGSVGSISGQLATMVGGLSDAQTAAMNAFASIESDADFMSDGVQSALSDAGASSDDFAAALVSSLSEAGASVEDFQGLTSEQLAQVAAAYAQGVDITPMIQGFVAQNQQGGEEGAQGFAQGIADNADQAKSASEEMAQSSADSLDVDTSGSGFNFSAGFANGISSGTYLAEAAARAAAQKAHAALKAEGQEGSPWRTTLRSGSFAAQGLALGIKAGISVIEDASRDAAGSAISLMSAGGSAYVVGKQTATDYAKGLASTATVVHEAASSVSGAADNELSDAEKKQSEYIDRMIAGYKARIHEAKATAYEFADALWGTIYPADMERKYVRPATGAVYDSMKVIEQAGYTLDSFIKKNEDYADKKADWDKKISEGLSDSQQDSFDEWNAEYQKWLDLNSQLSASFDDLQKYSSLYKVKDDLISNLDTTERWTDALGKLWSKAGVTYSQEFVEKIAAGGDDYLEAVEQMGDMTAEQVQEMVDSFDDLKLAEKEQELAQRSLYINSLKNLKMDDPKAAMVAFREMCLDVKEAVYSDKGLSAAFDNSKTSIEGFALDLQGLDVTMDDFKKSMESFVSSVSNGFQQMTKYQQTGLDEWSRNLKLNMAESQEYAANLEKVFSSISPEIDSEAFRKAIYEGGFSQWGQVVADLSKKSGEEIGEYIKLYNQSIAEAQQSAIEQFKALSPGEELMNAAIEGILGKKEETANASKDVAAAGAESAKTEKPAYNDAGVELAGEIAAGIQSQIDNIAGAAAATVRAAIEAARAAAGEADDSGIQLLSAGGGRSVVSAPSANVQAVQAVSAIATYARAAAWQRNAVQQSTTAAATVPQSVVRGSSVNERGKVKGKGEKAQNVTFNNNTTVNAIVREEADARKIAKQVVSIQNREAKARGY